ncbi:MAG: hypothetical protein J6M18_05750 [Actinomycetaceae bacterium]|nr:hypothetical protein [Actinomycetaceae bacterium]
MSDVLAELHNDDSAQTDQAGENNTKRSPYMYIAGVVILALIIAGLWAFRSTDVDEEYEKAYHQYTLSVSALNTERKRAEETNESCAKTVSDTHVCADLSNAINSAKNSPFLSIPRQDNPSGADIDQINEAKKNIDMLKKNLQNAHEAVKKASEETTNADNAKIVEDAKKLIERGNNVYESSQDKVADETTRQKLKQAVDNTNTAIVRLDAASDDAERQEARADIQKFSATITENIDLVQNSIKSKSEADQKESTNTTNQAALRQAIGANPSRIDVAARQNASVTGKVVRQENCAQGMVYYLLEVEQPIQFVTSGAKWKNARGEEISTSTLSRIQVSWREASAGTCQTDQQWENVLNKNITVVGPVMGSQNTKYFSTDVAFSGARTVRQY